MRSAQGVFKRHGRSGHRCFCLDFGGHRRVAAVQRAGADLLSVQPGDPQAGARAVHPQPDAVQPVAERVQHAAHSGRARGRGAARRRQRRVPGGGVPRHLPHHQLHAQHGSAQHRQVGGGGVPAQLPLENAAQGRSARARLHVDALALLRCGGQLPLVGRLQPALRVVHPLQRAAQRSRGAVRGVHGGPAHPHLPPHAACDVCHLPEGAESGQVSLQTHRCDHDADAGAAGGYSPQVNTVTV